MTIAEEINETRKQWQAAYVSFIENGYSKAKARELATKAIDNGLVQIERCKISV
jgi:hypothetical protein